MKGDVKAAVLEGKPTCPNIVVSCVCDTKPVNYVCTSTKSINWVEK